MMIIQIQMTAITFLNTIDVPKQTLLDVVKMLSDQKNQDDYDDIDQDEQELMDILLLDIFSKILEKIDISVPKPINTYLNI